MMGQGYSLSHWVIVLIMVVLYGVPVIKVIQKAGYSGWWLLVAPIPLVNLIMLWIFAYASWPNLKQIEAR